MKHRDDDADRAADIPARPEAKEMPFNLFDGLVQEPLSPPSEVAANSNTKAADLKVNEPSASTSRNPWRMWIVFAVIAAFLIFVLFVT
jgi:hypothetical protein